MRRVAVLIYNPLPGLETSSRYNFLSLERYMSRNPSITFDTYMHHWYGDDIVGSYKPIKCLYQCWDDTKTPIIELCKVVDHPDMYHLFMLVRLDTELADDLNTIDDIDPKKWSVVPDRLEFFGQEVFANHLMGINSTFEKFDLGSKCFYVRPSHKFTTFLESIEDKPRETAYISLADVYCRYKDNDTVICKFAPKVAPKSYQWVAKSLTTDLAMSYKLRVMNTLTINFSLPEFLHCLTEPNKWYKLDTKTRIGSTLISLDSYKNAEEIVMEIRDIKITKR